jgi:DNA repair photolyase
VNPYRGCSHACVYCFARNTHTYLDLDSGEDFDRELVVKVNIADVLRAEVSRPSWRREHVALGTNTDPYQRAEGRYRLMPGIIEALADSGTPLSILTKGTLLRRDLPLLRTAADAVPVDLAMSIAVYDDTLQDSLEPGTPTTAARLATVRAAADLGFPVRVFLMPVLPYLTDSTDQLNDALRRIKDAGADSVVYGALHLRPGAREWFFRWLDEHRPDLRGAYEGMYARSAYAPRAYRRMLSQRIGPLLQRWGLAAQHDDDHGSAPAAASGTRVARGPRVAPGATAASRARAQADQEQPALF